MTDTEMYQFIEKGMRGGISYIANRYSKANNEYMNDYNENEPSKYIMYLDANNIYGWAMSQQLPTGGFEWMGEEEIKDLEEEKINKKDSLFRSRYDFDSYRGLILEVDLEYPK